MTELNCGACGVDFCLPDALYVARRRDGRDFYCPNGHCVSYRPSEDQKRIAALEGELRSWQRYHRHAIERADELFAQREELVGALKQCPGCDWRSHRQVPRDPVAMGRGLERVRRDLAEHLVEVHGAVPMRPPQLVERT